jgi:hypothetical protein
MENDPQTAHTPATKGDLEKLEGKIVGKMEHLLSEQIKATGQKLDGIKKDMEQLLADQATVILEAVDELVEKKLDRKLGEKFDPVITKLDAVLKEFEDHRDEDIAGAEQLPPRKPACKARGSRRYVGNSCDECISNLFMVYAHI